MEREKITQLTHLLRKEEALNTLFERLIDLAKLKKIDKSYIEDRIKSAITIMIDLDKKSLFKITELIEILRKEKTREIENL